MAHAVPLCFDSCRQHALWVEAARNARPGGSSYCADCTPEYQQRMHAAQRCAYPGTRFVTDPDGFLEGRRSVAERISIREVA